MNGPLKGLIAGAAAWKFGGGIFFDDYYLYRRLLAARQMLKMQKAKCVKSAKCKVQNAKYQEERF